MTREELLKSNEFWIGEIQQELFRLIENYLKENNLTRIQFAEKLGVTKSYVSQILNGEFDHRLSKFVKLAMSIGMVPRIEFEEIEQVLIDDSDGSLRKPKSERPIINLQIYPDSQITLVGNKSKKIIINRSQSNEQTFSLSGLSKENIYEEETVYA